MERMCHSWRTTMAKSHDNIDYDIILDNIDTMINLLEYDSMRSSGKMKLNSQHLHSLYYLKDKYESMKPKVNKKEK